MTVVFDKSATLAGTDDGGGDSNLNFREVINSLNLSAATGTQVRVTILFGTACPTETGSLDALYIGRAATSGHAYDFNGNQVQLTFSGGTSVNGSAGSSQTSDWVTFGGAESYDNTKNIVFSVHIKNGSTCSISRAAVANIDGYYDFNSSSAGTTAPTLNNTDPGFCSLVSKIEIQAAATAISSKIYQTNFAVMRAANY